MKMMMEQVNEVPIHQENLQNKSTVLVTPPINAKGLKMLGEHAG